MPARLLSILGLLFLLSTGCGGVTDAPDRRIVKGTVTFNGEPLEGAVIRFKPQPSGPIAAGKVINGTYEVTNKGGVPIGKHRVEIKGAPILPADTEGKSLGQIDAETKPAIPIPDKYHAKSELEADVEPGSDPLIVDFELNE